MKVKDYNFAQDVLNCKLCAFSKDGKRLTMCKEHFRILKETDWLDDNAEGSL